MYRIRNFSFEFLYILKCLFLSEQPIFVGHRNSRLIFRFSKNGLVNPKLQTMSSKKKIKTTNKFNQFELKSEIGDKTARNSRFNSILNILHINMDIFL